MNVDGLVFTGLKSFFSFPWKTMKNAYYNGKCYRNTHCSYKHLLVVAEERMLAEVAIALMLKEHQKSHLTGKDRSLWLWMAKLYRKSVRKIFCSSTYFHWKGSAEYNLNSKE